MTRIRFNLIIALLALAVTFFPVSALNSSSPATTGDQIHQITVPVPGAPNYCSIGLTFDGDSLYYDRCNDPNIYKIDPTSGALEDTFNTGISEFPNALAFDSSRNGIWIGAQGCNTDGMPIYFWNFDDDSVVLRFTIPYTLINPATSQSFLNICFTDGLAFDANEPENPDDDEIWFSDDVNYNIGVFTPFGNFLRGYDARTVEGSLSTTSGLAIGGAYLYLANNGGGDVFRADRSTNPLALVDQFTSGDTRQEDMACDPITFDPIEVMWVRTTPQGGLFPDVITAYEIESNSCGFGGAPSDGDGDGLFDVWETMGIDLDGDDIIDVDLPAMGSDPNKKDIFVEVDWMEDDEPQKHSHKPKPEAIEKIVQAFADAPNGGINLHVDVGPDSIDYVTGQPWGDLSEGNSLPHQDVLGDDSDLETLEDDWETLKNENFGHSDRVFRYGLFVHRIAGKGIKLCTSGLAISQFFIVSLGGYPGCPDNPVGVGSENEQAGTFMHELGHTLGLRHGGNQEGVDENKKELFNYKPNYLSVMNYSFQFGGLIIDEEDGYFDYSRFDLPDLDETALSEPNGLNGGPQIDNYGTKHNVNFPFLCLSDLSLEGTSVFAVADNANGPINWDCDLVTDGGTVQEDVNGVGGNAQTLTSYNDWEHLNFMEGNIGLLGAPPPITITSDDLLEAPVEITEEESLQIQQLSEPRVRLSKMVIPETIQSGETVTYTITLTNTDAGDAEGVIITDTLPAGFTYQTGSTSGAVTDDPFIDGQTLVWGPIKVPGNDVATTIFYYADGENVPDTYFSNVSSSSTNGITFPTGDTAPVTIVLADLSITMIDTPDPVIAGTNLTYTITITNNGPEDAIGAILTDTLPAKVSFVSVYADQGTCEESNGTVACDLGGLTDSSISTIAINVNVSPSATGTITNTARVLGNEFGTATENNTATVITSIVLIPVTGGSEIYLPIIQR